MLDQTLALDWLLSPVMMMSRGICRALNVVEIAFVRRDSLQATVVGGGATRFIARLRDPHSCSWSPNGRFLACVSKELSAQLAGNAA